MYEFAVHSVYAHSAPILGMKDSRNENCGTFVIGSALVPLVSLHEFAP